jgi:hypothetical protein
MLTNPILNVVIPNLLRRASIANQHVKALATETHAGGGHTGLLKGAKRAGHVGLGEC